MNRLKTSVGLIANLPTEIATTHEVLQSSVDRSQHSSVATSVASSRHSSFPENGKKRAAGSSTLSRKLATQQIHRKRLLRATAISTKMINDTIQYLQTVSDHILISDTIYFREWATMHLATRLLQILSQGRNWRQKPCPI
ncbi:uncharacterized protein N7443_005202 [Penicillium atrosanguineum]|uniref:uncharacterized protein n=1 Tax=Penicillium atrosanguineum TaxID=1132637 RepID=UPI0023A5EB83|nr:uncharacterized protein N7443_005202 [Penicillium atrosanguineum]KAJ5305542.1 hypothetical protein N7443_005202 [Penicillium atrosanguineum]